VIEGGAPNEAIPTVSALNAFLFCYALNIFLSCKYTLLFKRKKGEICEENAKL